MRTTFNCDYVKIIENSDNQILVVGFDWAEDKEASREFGEKEDSLWLIEKVSMTINKTDLTMSFRDVEVDSIIPSKGGIEIKVSPKHDCEEKKHKVIASCESLTRDLLSLNIWSE